MIIREADFSKDWSSIVDGMWDFVQFAGYADFVPSERNHFETTMLELLRNPVFQVFLADDRGRPVAGIGVSQIPFLFNPELTMVEELFWWSTDQAPPSAAGRLLAHTVEWAQQSSGRTLLMMKRLSNSPEQLEQIYKRLGLSHVEISHMGVI